MSVQLATVSPFEYPVSELASRCNSRPLVGTAQQEAETKSSVTNNAVFFIFLSSEP
jgi:hypothetical protein